MNTVFVVRDDCCGGCGIVYAVFSSRPAAEEYILLRQPRVTHTLSIEDHGLDQPVGEFAATPPLLQRGQQFWFQGDEWKLLGTVNESDGQAFMENRGHDQWGARNLYTRQSHVFFEGFLINELKFERPALEPPAPPG